MAHPFNICRSILDLQVSRLIECTIQNSSREVRIKRCLPGSVVVSVSNSVVCSTNVDVTVVPGA